MLDDHSAAVLDGNVAVIRDNIRVLTEQAAQQADGDESFTMWIAQQRSELDLLLAPRAALSR